jgi:acetyl-CoA C-acetyltransferase
MVRGWRAQASLRQDRRREDTPAFQADHRERGLTDPINELNMGQTAKRSVTFASRAQSTLMRPSHKRLANAQAQGWLKGELKPRLRATANLPIARRVAGSHAGETGGAEADSSGPVRSPPATWQITDGIMDHPCFEDAVARHGPTPKAVIVDSHGPRSIPASWALARCCSTELMKRNKLSLADIETWELNEASPPRLGCPAA